jgi:mRNA-degrading endonuclease toxin of MazEF toxin-antitoxin module
MKDFDNWNEVKKKIDYLSSRKTVKLGEIYWCKLGLNIGTEQNGREGNFERPVIVIKKFSNRSVLVAPLTTQSHKGTWYFDIILFDRKQQIVLNQVKPIDTKRLLNSIGQISLFEIRCILREYIKLILS